MKNLIFEISIIPQTLNITNYRTPSGKPINLDIIRKLIEFSLKSNCVNAMFSLTVFGILLFKGRSVLWSVQLVTVCKRVQFSLRNQKWLPYKLRKFWMFFKIFWFCLTLSVTEKLKNLIFEFPIIPQTLNIRLDLKNYLFSVTRPTYFWRCRLKVLYWTSKSNFLKYF